MGEYKASRNNEQQKSEKEEKQEATAKAVDVGATMYLDSMSGGLASKLKNIPGVNGVWNKTVNRASKTISKTPVGDVANKLNKSGVTDAVSSGYNTYQGAKGGASSKTGKNTSSSSTNKLSLLSGNKTESNGSGNSNLLKKLMQSKKIPFALKVKIVVMLSFSFLFFIMIGAIIGYGKDFGNLLLTDGTETQGLISGGDLQPLDNYVFYASGFQKLSSPLNNDSISKINKYIIDSVDIAGYGTGAGVAAAGQALIDGFGQWGYYIPYHMGGGHYIDSANDNSVGVNPNWGSTKFGADYKGRINYGLDCSGFVSWAIRNGCNSNFSTQSTQGLNLGNNNISFNSLKSGDLILNPAKHVILVIKNDENGLVTAESMGSKGVVFSNYSSYPSGYFGVDMSEYYSTHCKKGE